MSILIILQCQLNLFSQAHQLFNSVSSFLHAQFLLIQFFFHSVFLWLRFSCSFSCYFFVRLVSPSRFEILIRSTATNSYPALCRVFVERSSVCPVSHHILSLCLRFQPSLSLQEVFCLFCCSSHFVFLFEISVKFTAMSCYSILCSILRKDLLFAISNFRSANFSSICIQHVRVNLVNFIDKDLISSVNQIQSKASNQL